MTERYYSWDEARKLARNDTEVDLTGEGPAYVPEQFEEDVTPEDALEDVPSDAPETPTKGTQTTTTV